MATETSAYDVHVERRGAHWISWITRGGATTPDRSVVLIAASEDEARQRAHEWARLSR